MTGNAEQSERAEQTGDAGRTGTAAPSGRGGCVVALDVGGTTTKGAVVGPDGALRFVERRPTGAERGPRAVVAGLLDFAAELADREPAVTAVGLAVPGLVDALRGTAVYAANLGWRDVPLRDLVERRLGLPVALDNDVRAGGLAEASPRGAGAGGDFLFVAIGTGIASAIVIDGRPYPGHTGDSGELGHVVVRPGGLACRCGRRGCVEAYASAAALARRGRAPAPEVVARGGRVWQEALDALAEALATATLLADPALVVLGGGLAESGDALLTPLAERLAARLPFRPAPPLRRAAFGALASLHGAGMLPTRPAATPTTNASTEG